eukprot:1284829-Prymnesium_polylepis.1
MTLLLVHGETIQRAPTARSAQRAQSSAIADSERARLMVLSQCIRVLGSGLKSSCIYGWNCIESVASHLISG